MTDTCTLREATYEDCETASELLRDLGLVMPQGRDAIRHHWQRFWIDNPALAIDRPSPAKGWLLEDDGRMVGFFGNIPLLYYYGNRPLVVADASQWGVEKGYRDQTPRLAESYFNQENADLLLVTTGIKPTGRIFDTYGGVPVPQADYDQVLYWVLDSHGFLKSGLTKKGFGSGMAAAAAAIGAPLLGAASSIGGHRLRGGRGAIDIIGTDKIDDIFDDLWKRKQNETERLLACRSAECLRWHFGTDNLAERTRILISSAGGVLQGYAIIMREDAAEIGLKRLKIVDLFVANDDCAVIDGLLHAAAETGRSEGCHVLELIGLPDNLRRQITSRHRPRSRQMPTWPLFYKSMDRGLDGPLGKEATWYVTAYDGDTAVA